jgi:hypothetical protein
MKILVIDADYYKSIRTHRSLDKDAPVSRPVQQTGIISSHAILGGLTITTFGGLGFWYTHDWYHVVGAAAIFGADDFGKIRPGAVAAGAGIIGVAI